MAGQNNAAAERSAHVERGERRIPGESFLVEVAPGVFQIKAVAEAQREVAQLQRDCADYVAERWKHLKEIDRMRSVLEKIAHSADYDTIICPDGDRHQQAIDIALEALGGSNV